MLGDLKGKLQPVGRLDVLDSVGDRALKYFSSLTPDELDSDTLGRRARALHLIGEIRESQGNLNAASQSFEEAEKTTHELLQQEPKNTQRIFEHSQSAYWAGYILFRQGQYAAARTKLIEYRDLAEKLTILEPNQEKWITDAQQVMANLLTTARDLSEKNTSMREWRLQLLGVALFMKAKYFLAEGSPAMAEEPLTELSLLLDDILGSTPEDIDAIELSARVQLLLGDSVGANGSKESSEVHWKKAVAIVDQNPARAGIELKDVLVSAGLRLGDKKIAEPALTELCRQNIKWHDVNRACLGRP